MRWNSDYALKDQEGEERIVRKFLLLPRQFGEGKHYRWLEYADIVERVLQCDVGGSSQWGYYAWKWCEVGFADDPQSIPERPRPSSGPPKVENLQKV